MTTESIIEMTVRCVPLFFDFLMFYLPPIEDNRRLKKPRSGILRDRSLLQLTEASDVYHHWPITNFF